MATPPIRSVRGPVTALWRDAMYRFLTRSSVAAGGGGDPNIARLANTFSRFAQTQETAYDTGAARSNGLAGGGLMERQVSNAIAQVLGKAPGTDAASFRGALEETYPTIKGRVSMVPSRGIVSIYAQNGNGITTDINGAISAGIVGQLSAEQQSFNRQITVVGADALSLARCIQSYTPVADA